MKGPTRQKEDQETRVRKRRVVGRIYGMKYCWQGHKDRNRHKKEWASLVGLCQTHKPQHPHHVKVGLWGLNSHGHIRVKHCSPAHVLKFHSPIMPHATHTRKWLGKKWSWVSQEGGLQTGQTPSSRWSFKGENPQQLQKPLCICGTHSWWMTDWNCSCLLSSKWTQIVTYAHILQVNPPNSTPNPVFFFLFFFYVVYRRFTPSTEVR